MFVAQSSAAAVAAGPTPPTLIGATQSTGTGSTGTMPTHAIGDLLIVHAYLASATIGPAVANWDLSQIFIGDFTNTDCLALYTRRATATNTTHPTITGASKVAAQSWRGSGALIGSSWSGNVASSSSATVNWLATNAFRTDGGSYGLLFGEAPSATNMLTNIPTGYTSVNGLAAGLVCSKSTAALSGGIATANQSISPSSIWLSVVGEILSSDTSQKPAVMGALTSVTATVTIPPHAIGDLIVITASRASTTQATKPTASGTVPAWVDIDAPTGTNARSIRTAYFVATATNHTSGTWTNATHMTATVVRGQHSTPIGGHGVQNNAAATSSTAPSITLTNTDGSSVILSIHCAGQVQGPPSGYARITEYYDTTTPYAIGINGKTSTTSVSTCVQTLTASAANSATQIEIRQH